jgi:hypothetical protein
MKMLKAMAMFEALIAAISTVVGIAFVFYLITTLFLN